MDHLVGFQSSFIICAKSTKSASKRFFRRVHGFDMSQKISFVVEPLLAYVAMMRLVSRVYARFVSSYLSHRTCFVLAEVTSEVLYLFTASQMGPHYTFLYFLEAIFTFYQFWMTVLFVTVPLAIRICQKVAALTGEVGHPDVVGSFVMMAAQWIVLVHCNLRRRSETWVQEWNWRETKAQEISLLSGQFHCGKKKKIFVSRKKSRVFFRWYYSCSDFRSFIAFLHGTTSCHGWSYDWTMISRDTHSKTQKALGFDLWRFKASGGEATLWHE